MYRDAGNILQNLCFFVLAYSGNCKNLSVCWGTNERDAGRNGSVLWILQPFLFYSKTYILESIISLASQKLVIAGSNKSFRHSLSHSLHKSHWVPCILGLLWMYATLKIQPNYETNKSHRRRPTIMIIVVLKVFKEKNTIQYEPKEINPCYHYEQKAWQNYKTLLEYSSIGFSIWQETTKNAHRNCDTFSFCLIPCNLHLLRF